MFPIFRCRSCVKSIELRRRDGQVKEPHKPQPEWVVSLHELNWWMLVLRTIPDCCLSSFQIARTIVMALSVQRRCVILHGRGYVHLFPAHWCFWPDWIPSLCRLTPSSWETCVLPRSTISVLLNRRAARRRWSIYNKKKQSSQWFCQCLFFIDLGWGSVTWLLAWFLCTSVFYSELLGYSLIRKFLLLEFDYWIWVDVVCSTMNALGYKVMVGYTIAWERMSVHSWRFNQLT